MTWPTGAAGRYAAELAGLTPPEADFWPLLIQEAVRLTGDQDTLPLCPRWLRRQLQEAALHGETLNGEALKEALEARQWRESFLADRMRDEILLNQIMIETEGEVVGQINGLSVIEFPAIHVRGASRHASPVLCIRAMASLPTWSAKRSLATFTPKA